MYGQQRCRKIVLFTILIIIFIMAVTKIPLQQTWSRNYLFLSNISDLNDCYYIVKPFFRFLCEKNNSFQPVQLSTNSDNHICYQLYSNKKDADLFSRVHIHFQPFKNRKILFSDIENLSNSCISCHHIQIIQNKLYIVPRANAFNYQTRSRSVKLLIKQMVDTFPNIPDLELFFHVDDAVELPDGFNDVLFNVPIFAFSKTNRTKRGLRPDGIVPMPCFTFWSWPEIRAGRWTKISRSILNTSYNLEYSKRVPKIFWRGVRSWKRIWFLKTARQYPNIMDLAPVSWQKGIDGLAYKASFSYKTLEEHCNYKYLAHLEGSSYSSRLKYLLLCGSPVVYAPIQYWEEYWYHLLKDGENIVFFESAGNEGAFNKTLEFLMQNEEKAKEIGRKGQQLVQDYLNEHAVSCYWWKLLKEYAKLLGYKPSLHRDAIYIDDFLLGVYA
ncbi:hypothetical protein I4U23_003796 [Adineta vaga]|nr:hypothetical protein I4U23_003796 [Adineta vaga]